MDTCFVLFEDREMLSIPEAGVPKRFFLEDLYFGY
jgi:hypothetical protein